VRKIPVRPGVPARDLPLWYFAFAHACLALAAAALTVRPDLPGGFFHHPRMVAVVHLITLGWISSSILGAFYIVGPLALRMPLPSGWRDRTAFGSFVLGVSGMVAHFWIGEYGGMAWSAALVIAGVLHVAVRAWRGLAASPVPGAVKIHVALAFANMLAASVFGIVVGLNRMFAWFAWSPMSAAFAHAHLAAIGWAVMMVVGLSYRLIPMIVPAAMPTTPALVRSAILLEAGVIVLATGLVRNAGWTPLGALLVLGGLASFVAQVRAIVQRKLPSPAALPRPDWATWQTHVAFGWLLLAAASGTILTLPVPFSWLIPLGWFYGVAGLIGFLAQVVVGIQGRLLPLHGWYRLFEAAGMTPPQRSAHTLPSHRLAKWILIAWSAGVPLLAAGLAASMPVLIRAGSICLLAGVVFNAVQAYLVASAGDGESGLGTRGSGLGAGKCR
jgi:hypothetical protein